jgi:hypothetical protein
VLVVAVAAVAAGSGFAVAREGGVPVALPKVTASVAATSTGHSYCDAARDALEYEGHDAAHRDELVDRVIAKAPPELVSIMVTVRHSKLGSEVYVKAHRLWDYYNNNHCCKCIDAYYSPQIYQLTPEQRAHIEAGKRP